MKKYSYAIMDTEAISRRLRKRKRNGWPRNQSSFDTYYQELLTKLILGQASMDDWDSYQWYEGLGLDKIDFHNTQERYDRAQPVNSE